MMMVGTIYLVLGMFMSVFFKVNAARPRFHRMARVFLALGAFEIIIYAAAFLFFNDPGERSFYQTMWGAPVIAVGMLYFMWLVHKEMSWHDNRRKKEGIK